MLQVSNLTKQYKHLIANNNLNFSIESGEIGILVGPNGAGKSTAIKCICGLLRFAGEVYIDGYPNKTVEAKKRFGYIPEIPTPFEALTVAEHMEFIGRTYQIKNWEIQSEALLKRMQLLDQSNKLSKELSKGMQQKLTICCALLSQPKVILFDEPFVGLDPHAIKQLKEMILELKQKGCAILISTHMLDSVNELWDKVLIMMKGNIVAIRTKSELLRNGENLEQLFFSITEDGMDREG